MHMGRSAGLAGYEDEMTALATVINAKHESGALTVPEMQAAIAQMRAWAAAYPGTQYGAIAAEKVKDWSYLLYGLPAAPAPFTPEPPYYPPAAPLADPGVITINPPIGSGGRTVFVPQVGAPPSGFSYSPPAAGAPIAADGFDLEGWLPWIIGGAAAGFLLLRR